MEGKLQEGALDHLRPTLSERNAEALKLWNAMGGLDWTALPIVAELYDVDDLRDMVDRLLLIRDNR